MPVDVLTERVIERPCAVVAAYAGDPSHAPEWYANIKSVDWLTEPPLRVGSKLTFAAQFRELASETEGSVSAGGWSGLRVARFRWRPPMPGSRRPVPTPG